MEQVSLSGGGAEAVFELFQGDVAAGVERQDVGVFRIDLPEPDLGIDSAVQVDVHQHGVVAISEALDQRQKCLILRGDNPGSAFGLLASCGSPPRAWGQRRYRASGLLPQSVHPHVRGDNPFIS